MPTTSERATAEMERWSARGNSAATTGNGGRVDAATTACAKLAEAALTTLLTLCISANLVIAWLWVLAMWYPASSTPAEDPNHGCGPMVACLHI